MKQTLGLKRHGIEYVVVAATLMLSLLLLAGCAGGPLSVGTPKINFSISATPGAQTVKAGNGAVYAVTINPAALIGTVNLSTSALPSGVTASFGSQIDVLAGQKSLYLFTTENTPAVSAPITIMATDPTSGTTHTATVNITITPAADFTLSATPMSQNVKPGESATYTIHVAPSAGISTSVALSTQNLPSGVTASFNPATVTGAGSSTLTISTDASANVADSSFLVVGTDTSGSYSVPADVVIAPADFSIVPSATPIEIQAGGSYPTNVNVQGLFGGMPGNVMLSASGLPSGAAVSFAPPTVSGVGLASMTISTDSSTPPGNYTLTVQGSDASGTNSAHLAVAIAAGTPGIDVYLGVSPIVQNITSGDTATFNVFLSGPGANGSVPLTVSSDQGGVSPTIQPVSGQPNAYLLNVATDSYLILSGTATVTITATTLAGNQTIQVQVLISPPPPIE